MTDEDSPKKIGAKVAKGGSIILTARISQGVIAAAFTIIVARLLGAKAYGMFGVALSLVSILSTMGQFGIPKAITKYVSEYTAKEEWGHVRSVLRRSFKYLLVLGLIFSGGLILLAGPIATQIYHNPELTTLFRVGAVALLTWIAFYGFSGAFTGFQKMKHILFINVSYQAVRLIAAITFIYVGFLATGALLSIAAGYAFAVALSFFVLLPRALPSGYSPQNVRTPDLSKEILLFSAPVWISGLAGTLLIRLGPMILGSIGSMNQAGYFTAAFSISIYAIRLPGALGTMLFPSVSERWALKDKQGLRTALKTSIKLIFTILIPLIAGGVVFSDIVMFIVFGKGYVAGANVLRILLLAFLFWSLDSMNSNVLQGIERPKTLAAIRWASVGVSLPSMVLLALKFGATGAAMGLGLGVGVASGLGIYYSAKLTGISYPFEVFPKPLAATGVMLLFLYPASLMIDSVILAILAGLLGLALYGYIFLKIGGIKGEDMGVLREMSDSLGNPWIFEKIIDFVGRYT